jgi:hypothetical protein
MLDLVYLDEDEPWSPGDLQIFSRLATDNPRFVMAVDILGQRTLEHSVRLSSWSSTEAQGVDRYKADWYVSFVSALGTDIIPHVLQDGVKLWRVQKPNLVFHLQRYSTRDDPRVNQTVHWGHFVVTNKPEEFPQSTIKIL